MIPKFRLTTVGHLFYIEYLLGRVLNKENNQMSKLTDMNDAIGRLVASDAALHDEIAVVTDLIKTLAAGQGDPDTTAAVNAALAGLNDADVRNAQDKQSLVDAVAAVSASGGAPNV